MGALVEFSRGSARSPILPMAHIADACARTPADDRGLQRGVLRDPKRVTELLRGWPHFFFSPPRLWEKLQASIAADVRQGSTNREIRRRLGFDKLTAAVTGAAPSPPR